MNRIGSIKAHLRTSALLEGISFLVLLLIAMPLKYYADSPMMVRVVGMAHGVLFIWYIIAVFLARDQYRFNVSQTLISLAASLFPFGTFYADHTIFKKLP
jgi:integral membrane protein